MLKIRLQRTGKRGQAYFRVVVLEHTKKPKGKFLELLGNYDPHKKEFKVDMERVNHWVSNGAQVSPTLHNMFVDMNILSGEKVKAWKPKKGSAKKETSVPVASAPVVSAETVESAPEEKTEVAV